MAKDSKGKKIYSNMPLRYAELALRLQKDEKYQGWKKKNRKLRNELRWLRVECDRLVDRKAISTGFYFEDEKRI